MNHWFARMTAVNIGAVAPIRLGLACAMLGILLAACAGSMVRPEIKLAGVELVGFGRAEQRLALKFEIGNPNDIDFALTALRFDLELDDIRFASGAISQAVVVPAHGTAPLEAMSVSRLAQVFAVLGEARKRGDGRLRYRLSGFAEVDGYGHIPFSRQGEISLSALLSALPKYPR